MTSLLQPGVRYLRVRDGSGGGGRGAVINRGRVLPVRYRRMLQVLHLLVNVAGARRRDVPSSSFDHRQRWVEGQCAGQHLTGEGHP